MSYTTIEAGVQTLLRALSRFAEADVTRGDWRVLDSGGAPCVVLYPGPFEAEEAGDWGQKWHFWTVYADVFERYTDNGSSETAFEATRQDVMDTIHAYPTLNGVSGVTRALARRGGDLQYIYDRDGGGPYYVMQQITIEVVEKVSYDGSGEFA